MLYLKYKIFVDQYTKPVLARPSPAAHKENKSHLCEQGATTVIEEVTLSFDDWKSDGCP